MVFSAHAEVVPPDAGTPPTWWSILRARGGSSMTDEQYAEVKSYSPRTRR